MSARARRPTSWWRCRQSTKDYWAATTDGGSSECRHEGFARRRTSPMRWRCTRSAHFRPIIALTIDTIFSHLQRKKWSKMREMKERFYGGLQGGNDKALALLHIPTMSVLPTIDHLLKLNISQSVLKLSSKSIQLRESYGWKRKIARDQ